MTTVPLTLVGHLLMEHPTLPPIPWPFGYVHASNGIFAWGKREGLEVLLPVASCAIRGLYPVTPFFRPDYPPVAESLLTEIIQQASAARTPRGDLLETLLYLVWDAQQGWHLYRPPQEQTPGSVLPRLIEPQDVEAYSATCLEIHSHGRMSASFSQTDSADEQHGFRIFGVIGHLAGDGHVLPEIRLRVGLYGHFWEIPAGWILSLPWGVVDCVVRDQALLQKKARQYET